jgi:hypothetical protein
LRTLLVLPLAERYHDVDSDDRNGLWVGNVYCAFRQENAATNNTHVAARDASSQRVS